MTQPNRRHHENFKVIAWGLNLIRSCWNPIFRVFSSIQATMQMSHSRFESWKNKCHPYYLCRAFERSGCFYVTAIGSFECFQDFDFETNLLKNEIPKSSENFFLVVSTNMKHAIFSYKTALSKANAETNRMVSTKWTYRK